MPHISLVVIHSGWSCHLWRSVNVKHDAGGNPSDSSFIIFLHVFIFAILVLCWYCLPSTLMAFLRGGGARNRSSNLGETPHLGPA